MKGSQRLELSGRNSAAPFTENRVLGRSIDKTSQFEKVDYDDASSFHAHQRSENPINRHLLSRQTVLCCRKSSVEIIKVEN